MDEPAPYFGSYTNLGGDIDREAQNQDLVASQYVKEAIDTGEGQNDSIID